MNKYLEEMYQEARKRYEAGDYPWSRCNFCVDAERMFYWAVERGLIKDGLPVTVPPDAVWRAISFCHFCAHFAAAQKFVMRCREAGKRIWRRWENSDV